MKLSSRRAFAHQALALAALAAVPTLQAQPAADVMTPAPALFIQNIPPVAKSLAERMAAYTEFRGHGFSGWHPTKAEMLVSHREAGASTAQLFRLDAAMGTLKPVTVGPEPAGGGSYEPKEGRYIVFSRASGGSTPKASHVRKNTFRGWPARPDGSQFGMKSTGYAPRVFSVSAWLP